MVEEFSDSDVNLNIVEGDKGFNPQWNLLVNNNLDVSKGSKDGSKKSKQSSSQQDEGDVGSTRENTIIKESMQKRRASRKISRVARSDIDVKKNWLKATYGNVTKRVYNSSMEIEELKIALWMRFGALRDRFQDPGSLQVLAQLPKPAEFEAVCDDGLEMPLMCSEDLQSFIYQTQQEKGVCPRIIIRVDKSTAERKSVPRNIFNKSKSKQKAKKIHAVALQKLEEEAKHLIQ